ncbi:hypothetical protein ACFL01_02870, partial [Planctomycetota bacterium]
MTQIPADPQVPQRVGHVGRPAHAAVSIARSALDDHLAVYPAGIQRAVIRHTCAERVVSADSTRIRIQTLVYAFLT